MIKYSETNPTIQTKTRKRTRKIWDDNDDDDDDDDDKDDDYKNNDDDNEDVDNMNDNPKCNYSIGDYVIIKVDVDETCVGKIIKICTNKDGKTYIDAQWYMHYEDINNNFEWYAKPAEDWRCSREELFESSRINQVKLTQIIREVDVFESKTAMIAAQNDTNTNRHQFFCEYHMRLIGNKIQFSDRNKTSPLSPSTSITTATATSRLLPVFKGNIVANEQYLVVRVPTAKYTGVADHYIGGVIKKHLAKREAVEHAVVFSENDDKLQVSIYNIKYKKWWSAVDRQRWIKLSKNKYLFDVQEIDNNYRKLRISCIPSKYVWLTDNGFLAAKGRKNAKGIFELKNTKKCENADIITPKWGQIGQRTETNIVIPTFECRVLRSMIYSKITK